jgi:hypothetical protein
MTLQYVLRQSLCRAPHCFRAWVQGKGYVNDGSAEYDQADYVVQYLHAATSEIENMTWAPAYAEPGYTQPAKGILLANWNVLPSDVGPILERMGYSLEWSDEWSTCDECYKAVRTQPDSYDWRPSWTIINGSEMLCAACMKDQGVEHASNEIDEDDSTDVDL